MIAAKSRIASASMTRRQAWLVCVSAGASVLVCYALCAVAILAPAPVAVVPLIAACCVVMPIMAVWQLPIALPVIGVRPAAERATIAEFQRRLRRLPEVEHPLGW